MGKQANCSAASNFSPIDPQLNTPIVIAIDGTSASGKSSSSKQLAKSLDYVYVDTGAMYRTLAWHCLQKRIDVHDAKVVAEACRRWKTSLVMLING